MASVGKYAAGNDMGATHLAGQHQDVGLVVAGLLLFARPRRFPRRLAMHGVAPLG
jgi:hypothetical protein